MDQTVAYVDRLKARPAEARHETGHQPRMELARKPSQRLFATKAILGRAKARKQEKLRLRLWPFLEK